MGSFEDQIHVDNFSDGDQVFHSVVVLRGHISNVKKLKHLKIYLNQLIQHSNKTDCYNDAYEEVQFKCVMELKRNKNELKICYNNEVDHYYSGQMKTQYVNEETYEGILNEEPLKKTEEVCIKNYVSRRTHCSRLCFKRIPENYKRTTNGSESTYRNIQNLNSNKIPNERKNANKICACTGCAEEQTSTLLNFKSGGVNFNNTHFNSETEDVFHQKEQISKENSNSNKSVLILNKIVYLSSDLNNMNLVGNSSVNLNENVEAYNEISHFGDSPSTLHLTLFYIPRETQLTVAPVYIIPKNHHGRFQALEECGNSIENACRKITLGVKLIQCLIAMLLPDSKTFQLEHEVSGDSNLPSSDDSSYINDCLVFYSSLTLEEVNSLSEEKLWELFGRELMMSKWGSARKKFVAFLSSTRCTEGRVLSHAAIGGGGLALFGTGCLHTWPSYVNEIVNCFRDSTPVNANLLMDDSCNRGTYSGCFSTTLGAVCHELGHTLDLGHSRSGIMGRGFDFIDSLFLVRPSSADYRKKSIRRPIPQANPNRQEPEAISTQRSNLNIPMEKTQLFSTPLYKATNNINDKQNKYAHKTGNESIFVDFVPSSRNDLRKKNIYENDFGCGTENYVKHCRSGEILSQKYCDKIEMKYHSLERNQSYSVERKRAQWHSLEREQSEQNSEGEVFWSENCAVMLNHHRWLNSYAERNVEDSQCSDLKFDSRRNTVTSSAGLCLVELRGQKGLCLRYWSFAEVPGTRNSSGIIDPSEQKNPIVKNLGSLKPSGAPLRRCFIIPVQHLRSALTLVAMDHTGNIVKVELR